MEMRPNRCFQDVVSNHPESRRAAGSDGRQLDKQSLDARLQPLVTTVSGEDQAAAISPGDYSPNVCGSPKQYYFPESTSDESMNAHGENLTPPESPGKPGSSPVNLGRLSLDDERARRGRGLLSASPQAKCKRAASKDLPRPPGRQSPGGKARRNSQSTDLRRMQAAAIYNPARRGPAAQYDAKTPVLHDSVLSETVSFDHHAGSKKPSHFESLRQRQPVPRDSGYESVARVDSMDSVPPTVPPKFGVSLTSQPPLGLRDLPKAPPEGGKPELVRPPGPKKYSLILQPESSPISQDQLTAELKGIYAGLVMVEAKCINIDLAQENDPTANLGPEQWQALIALHRTLLYEHHDFLMATQHPSATPALRGLPVKYGMPARMWKHGIHAFLEVLRHRRPASQDYMLSFIYLAYQMMALLFETVPAFLDTWIECLGDLARYRMAIEDEKETHAQWGSVAARWYSMSAERHPTVGRLNHHLGILERPSLRKFFYYSKSLTCVSPFPNAMDSLYTLCKPIVEDEETVKGANQTAEARIVTFHAMLFFGQRTEEMQEVASSALYSLTQVPSTKLRDIGVSLAITNISALLQLGAPENYLTRAYRHFISSTTSEVTQNSTRPTTREQFSWNTHMGQLAPSSIQLSFCYSSINSVLRTYDKRSSQLDTLAYVHIMLVWLHSVINLASQIDGAEHNTCKSLLGPESFFWGGLAGYLNSLAQYNHPITTQLVERAHDGVFPVDALIPDPSGRTPQGIARPLAEDYLIRGLVWTQWYFTPRWFEGTEGLDGHAIETPATQEGRILRVLWLGLYLASHTGYLTYDKERHFFSAHVPGVTMPFADITLVGNPIDTTPEVSSEGIQTPLSRSSTTQSTSEVEEGFTMVRSPTAQKDRASIKSPPTKTTPTPRKTWANVASDNKIQPRKVRQDYSDIQVVDQETADDIETRRWRS